MQTKLNYFLGLDDQEYEPGDEDFGADTLQQGNHYWTGVKTAGQLSLPGKSDYELMAEILTLQYSKVYSKVATHIDHEYIFDPD